MTRPEIRRSCLAPASLIVGLILVAGFAPAGAADHTVTGTVRYEGPQLEHRVLKMNADPKCEELHDGPVHDIDRVVAKDGGLSSAFVFLETVPAGLGPFPPPATPVELLQQGCLYHPRVIGIQVGQKLSVVNGDPTLHNVRFLAKTNRPFNIGQPPNTPPRSKLFTESELAVKFKCDVHPWMAAYLFVMDHPFFATTDEHGRFSIAGLPAGSHTLVVWHEAFGERKVQVEVGPATSPLTVTFD